MIRLAMVLCALLTCNGHLLAQKLVSWSGRQRAKIAVKTYPFPDGADSFPRHVNYINSWREALSYEIINGIDVDEAVSRVRNKIFYKNWCVGDWVDAPKISKIIIDNEEIIKINKFNRLDGEIHLVKLGLNVAIISSSRLRLDRLAMVYRSLKRANLTVKPSAPDCLGGGAPDCLKGIAAINSTKDVWVDLDNLLSDRDKNILMEDIAKNRQEWGVLGDGLIHKIGLHDGSPLARQFENRGIVIPIEMATRLLYAYRGHLLGRQYDMFASDLLPPESMPFPPPMAPIRRVKKVPKIKE